MMRMKVAVATVVLMTAMMTAQAARSAEEVFEPGKPLVEQIRKIEGEMQDGKTYSEIGLDPRSRVREALGRMQGIIEQYPDQAKLPENERTALFNDQQVVTTVLTKAREDSRLICRREKAVGSHFSVNQCMTVAQRERLKSDSQRDMSDAQRTGKLTN